MRQCWCCSLKRPRWPVTRRCPFKSRHPEHSILISIHQNKATIPNKGRSHVDTMPDIQVGTSGVHKLLKNLKVHKTTGPDGILARLLKEKASQIVPAITLLFQASLSQGSVPEKWERANVAPIFKMGDKHKAENYRPISLTAILCKLQEHIISSQIMQHLAKNQHPHRLPTRVP